MDTAAYLTNQGWRGNGHALHHSGRGIAKPILVSQKQNVLGIGKKKHDAHADQWWARAFDATLKGINSSEDGSRGKTEGISLGAGAQALRVVGKGGAKCIGQRGLYSNFVKGDGLNGTLTPKEAEKSEDNERSKAWGVDGDHRSEGTTKRKTSKRRQQEEEWAQNSRATDSHAVAQDRNQTRMGLLQSKADDRESKEKLRERRKERRARRALKDDSLTQSLPTQVKANVDDGEVHPAARIETAVSGDCRSSGSRSESTKKKR